MSAERSSRLAWLLPLAAIGLGCSSTGRFRPVAEEPKIRTIASIGDRPIGSVAGVPTASGAADLGPIEPRRDRASRVAGRVVDELGEPVPNARVRLADGGIAGGRVVEATTDRSGGFSLNGLRPGTTYTLIAETEGQWGRITGRSDVRPPDAYVEIAVRADDLPSDRRRAGRAPSARKVSERQPARGADDAGDRSARLNSEDLPESTDVEDIDDLARSRPAPRRPSSPRGHDPVSGTGWTRGRKAPARDDSASATTRTGDGDTRRASAAARPADDDPPAGDRGRDAKEAPDGGPPEEAEDDEENPLPPAIDPGAGRGRGVPPPRERAEAARPPGPSRRVARPTTNPGVPPGVLSLAKGVKPAGEGEPAPAPPAEPAPEPEPEPDVDPFEAAAKPAEPAKPKAKWGDLSAAWRSVPRVEAVPLVAYPAVVARSGRPDAADRGPAPPATAARSTSRAARGREPVEACRYDTRRRQILEFRMPDLQGKAVSWKDLDSDFILVDFWGTWCRPCLDSIPHLMALKKQYGDRTLTVVGIACEDGPAPDAAKRVAEAAERLGIDYTVLLASKDGPSPVQEALQVQAYPTMILLDRKGRVIWREQGASPMTLARLDRALDTSTRAAIAAATPDRFRR